MKVSINKIIRYFEVDAEYRLKLGVLFQLLQETVIRHTEAVGMSTQEILEQRGTAWVLHTKSRLKFIVILNTGKRLQR